MMRNVWGARVWEFLGKRKIIKKAKELLPPFWRFGTNSPNFPSITVLFGARVFASKCLALYLGLTGPSILPQIPSDSWMRKKVFIFSLIS
jgi:hypothetical protein